MKTIIFTNAFKYFLYIIISLFIIDYIYILCTTDLQNIVISWTVSQLIIDILSIFLVRYIMKSIASMKYDMFFVAYIISFTIIVLFLLILPYLFL